MKKINIILTHYNNKRFKRLVLYSYFENLEKNMIQNVDELNLVN